MITRDERKVIDYIVLAHNEYVKLPVQHPQDQAEWCAAIHVLQRIVMAREAVINNPDYFINIE